MDIEIIRGDITKKAADAIVNAANTSLLGGGGVDGAIHRATGSALLAECRTLGGCKTGQVKITKGYNLPAKCVIHTPGPVWQGCNYGEPELLRSCYERCLEPGVKYSCATMAFPSVSTGIYGYPEGKASLIAMETMKNFDDPGGVIKKVAIICFDLKTKEAYDAAAEAVLTRQ